MTNIEALPREFIIRLKQQLGDEFEPFMGSLKSPPPVSVRLNPARRVSGFDHLEKVAWATDAYYLPERISFTLDPLFHAGCYYVQEASSMFLEYALRKIVDPDVSYSILDLCAAPGGKSTHILSTVSPESLLVSNELVSTRNRILRQNLAKWGNGNVIVTQNEAGDFGRLSGFFDIIVVDAPCSGEGLFRKQPAAIQEWSADAVRHCASRQTDILTEVIPALKEGGFLIYCTCTWESDENENQVDRLVEEFNLERVDLGVPYSGIVGKGSGYRFYPHRVKGEGFFLAVLKKRGQAEQFKTKSNKQTKGSPGFFDKMLANPGAFAAVQRDQDWYAIPQRHLSAYTYIRDNLYIRKAGVHMGTLKGTELVPSHELALCHYLHPETEKIDLEKQAAIEFLRCGIPAVSVPPKGWYLATYMGYPLGWLKSVGSRFNSYFPKEFRIVSNLLKD